MRAMTLTLALVLTAAGPAVADGIMHVAAGAFWMGRDGGPAQEAPEHRVFVRVFCNHVGFRCATSEDLGGR